MTNNSDDKQTLDSAHKLQMQLDRSPAKHSSPLPTVAETEIAQGLKRLYGQMLSEPMPSKFAGLLEELARQQPGTAAAPDSDDPQKPEPRS